MLVYLIHFPIFPGAAFLEYDPADIPILVGATALRPCGRRAADRRDRRDPGLHRQRQRSEGVTMASSCTSSPTTTSQGPGAPPAHLPPAPHPRAVPILGLICGTIAMGLAIDGRQPLQHPYFMGAPVEVVDAVLLPVNPALQSAQGRHQALW
ncbi:MAG: hypothetical protein ACLUNZ_10820 [Evtepia sp.]